MIGKRILLAEDEPSIAEVVSLYLERADFTVKVVTDGEAAQKTLERSISDLVILDIMLPGIDGYSLTRWLRGQSDVPIIMLTSRRDEIDRITGLELGADDYVVKPFSPQELVSRVRAVLRRTSREKAVTIEQELLEFHDLVINPTFRVVHLSGEEKELTAKEFDMLYLLASHPRQVFKRIQLLEHIWGEVEYIDPSTVTVHIRRLREKIEVNPSKPNHLITVWGIGYKFEP